MIIRRATVADVPARVALNRVAQSLHATGDPRTFRRDPPDRLVAQAFEAAIEASGSYWLLAEVKRPAGYLSAEFRHRDESWCMISHPLCYIAGIVVAPEYRRRGVARALLGELSREASVRGVARIELDVWSFNAAARKAFVSLGFRPAMERMTLSSCGPNNPAEPTTFARPSRSGT